VRGNRGIRATKASLGLSFDMPRILTTCPTTGEPVPTGYRAADLDLTELDGPWSFRCTVCREVHAWTPAEATVEAVTEYVA